MGKTITSHRVYASFRQEKLPFQHTYHISESLLFLFTRQRKKDEISRVILNAFKTTDWTDWKYRGHLRGINEMLQRKLRDRWEKLYATVVHV